MNYIRFILRYGNYINCSDYHVYKHIGNRFARFHSLYQNCSKNDNSACGMAGPHGPARLNVILTAVSITSMKSSESYLVVKLQPK